MHVISYYVVTWDSATASSDFEFAATPLSECQRGQYQGILENSTPNTKTLTGKTPFYHPNFPNLTSRMASVVIISAFGTTLFFDGRGLPAIIL